MAKKLSSLTFITSNPAKATQLSQHLDFPVRHKKIDLPEIQSLNLEDVARHKTQQAYTIVKKPVLVEDTSLVFQVFGNLPGPFIKWFLVELGNDGLCRLLNSSANRRAQASVVFCLYDGKRYKTFAAQMPGTIARKPRGNSGFGWDSIFIPQGQRKTWGEMDTEEQKQTSMRRIALKKLQKYLQPA